VTTRAGTAILGAVTLALTLAGCATGPAAHVASSLPVPSVAAPATSAAATTPTPTPTPRTSTSHPPTKTRTPTHAPASRSSASSPAPRPRQPAAGAPVIVVDPGHSVSVGGTDPATGLNVADYENEPEMRDVWDVALLVQKRLQDAGYRVIITKKSLYAPTNLGTRADIANAAHAALALSIHDQAGSNGGIGFDAGNNMVYYQSVGDYRTNPQGRKITFTDAGVAALSKNYAEVFQRERAAVQHTSITLLGNTGYDLGGRGLQSGNIWMVQLLAHVPWIYNEAGGNSAGMVGLSNADKQRYADGLVAAVEACVPVR
jgi:N-acetylmuramoyl-L-alanine amidase